MKNLISVFLIAVLFTGCFAGRKADKAAEPAQPFGERRSGEYDWKSFVESEKADFYISGLSAEAKRPDENYNSETGSTTFVEYTFKMKIKSRANRRSLVGFEFLIKGKFGEEQFRARIIEQDTLTWTEKIEFDEDRPQSDPVLVVKEVIGLGAAKGTAHAIYEINPWAITEGGIREHFRDLSYDFAQLQERHSHYNPDFNYIAYLQAPYASRDPHLVVKSARFYINKKEEINEAISRRMGYDHIPQASVNDPIMQVQTQEDYLRGNSSGIGLPNYVERTGEAEAVRPLGLRLGLTANLKLEKKYWIGEKEEYTDIDQGRFKVFAALLGTNQGLVSTGLPDAPILLAVSSAPQEASIHNKNLTVNLDLLAPYLVNRGDVELAIKVVPEGEWSQRGLKPFGVVYKLGPYNKISGFAGDFRTKSSSDPSFDFDDYLGKIRNLREKYNDLLIESGLVTDVPAFTFSAMNIKFRTVKAGETASQRTVIFSVTTCPFDGLTGARLAKGRQFKVSVSGFDPLTDQDFTKKSISDHRGGSDVVKVRDDNCISWIDEIAHKYYQREKLIDRKYYLEADDGQIFELSGHFNPWDEKFGTLGVDSRTLSPEFINEVKSRQKLPSRFFAGDFSYMTLRFRYNVDENMNLTVRKTVLMNMYPFIKRYSNIINGINGNFPIRDGIYLLKLAYQKDFIDPGAEGVNLQRDDNDSNRVKISVADGNTAADRGSSPFILDDLRRQTMIHTTKKLIRVENNRVLTPIEFEIKDLRTLRIRANLLIQLEPVNQYKVQIVNLFEKHIAKKLTLAIGNLNDMHCLDPGVRDIVLDLFQDTLDRIAMAIPDDVNYNSVDSFYDVIHSPAVAEALRPLTNSDLLDGIANTFSLGLSREEIHDAFKFMNADELANLEGVEDLDRVLAERDQILFSERAEEVREENVKVLGVLGQLAAQAASLYSDSDAMANNAIAPINDGDDTTGVPSLVGSSEGDISAAVAHMKPDEPEVDQHTRDFLNEISGEEDLSTLLNNDFTIDPAVARVSDLDLLIDRKAGIIRRTFVGPLTLLALDNKNTMNATDALDYNYCSTDDCSGQKIRDAYGDDLNYNYARSHYFGYQGEFKNCHVDDLIINKDEVETLAQAWTECAVDLPRKSNGEVIVTKGFVCDYKSTRAYQQNPKPFKRYDRLPDEKLLENGGQCFYRDIWLKKYFAQRRTEEAQNQFSNFLSHPTVTAKLITPPKADRDRNVLRVSSLDNECVGRKFLDKSCIGVTDKFNFSSDELVKAFDFKSVLFNFFKFPAKKSYLGFGGFKEAELEEGPHKNTLEKFYNDNADVFENYTPLSDERKANLSASIYETLESLASPEGTNIERPGTLPQTDVADFNADVHKFMCLVAGMNAFKYYSEVWDEELEALREKYKHTRRQGSMLYDLELRELNQRRGEVITSLSRCFEYTNSETVEVPRPFVIERRYRILDTGRYFFRGGKSINFNTGQSVSVGHGVNWNSSFGFDPYNSARDAALSLLPSQGVLGKASKVAKELLGAFKLTSYSQGESNSRGDGLSLNTGTHLSMQAAQLDLELTRYRRCLLVRWNKRFLDRALGNEKYEQFKAVLPLLTNMFVCGEEQNNPVAVTEDFYYITQHFTEGDMLDSGSLLNNPWLLTLRGQRDMVAFVTSLYPESEYEPSIMNLFYEDLGRLSDWERPKFTRHETTELNQRATTDDELVAWQSMAKAYRAVAPTFPGLYTVPTSKEREKPDWPWSQEVQISEPELRECPNSAQPRGGARGEGPR